ncbi:hypothetical protein [Nonomuraea fuscirosea]|uniref:hypothetical protein n=1 Tax=Nonomuraea fuscirosea TaxID=1291556 RepID=UPI003448BB31
MNDALPSLDWVQISDRKAEAIKLSPIEAAPEPRNLRRIKNEVARRWSAVPLIDILKEAILRTGCLGKVTAATGTGRISPAEALWRITVRTGWDKSGAIT